MAAYILAGLLAGVAGICLFPRFNAGGAVEGLGWELRILAAAAVGGAMLGRQRGVIWGTVVGAALIALIDFGGQQLGVIGPMRNVLLGALFVAVLAIDRPTVAAQVSPAHL